MIFETYELPGHFYWKAKAIQNTKRCIFLSILLICENEKNFYLSTQNSRVEYLKQDILFPKTILETCQPVFLEKFDSADWRISEEHKTKDHMLSMCEYLDLIPII